jgi:translation initiation factor IF-1
MPTRPARKNDVRSTLKDAPTRRPTKIGPIGRKGAVEVEGTVLKLLPHELYLVRVDETKQKVTAHLSADENRNFVRIIVGDRVIVRLSFWDKMRGCVMEKV